jgi:phosphoglycolate phosphatase
VAVLIFDLEGTLTDPIVGIVACTRHALAGLDRSLPPDDYIASFIGPPLRRMFSTLLETADRELIEQAVALYRGRYADVGIFETRVYDAVPQMLASARGLASRMFLATSKPAIYAERILEHVGLRREFDGVYGTGLDGRFDDKADLLRHLSDTEQLRGEEAVMIGDRGVDTIAARANGMLSIGTLWGYGSREELEQAGADRICGLPSDLEFALSDLY